MTTNNAAILAATQLGQTWQGKCVFENVSLSLGHGFYPLQSPNGIGKTTLLSILCGAIEADAGNILVGGSDLARALMAARRKFSWVPDEAYVYPFLSGRKWLQPIARAKQVKFDDEVQVLAECRELRTCLDQRIDAMSLDTRKKSLLLAGIVGKPMFNVADEPGNALDTQARAVVAERFCALGDRAAVLFASHGVDFIAQTRAAVIDMRELL